MQKSILPFLVGSLIISMFLFPNQYAAAQVLTLPAEMNKGFLPLSIPVGGTSRLRVSIYNPNSFPLNNASWTDNLIGVQPGLVIANPVGLVNTCGGSVTAAAGSTTLSLTGGTVPPQVGTTPGSCTVSINVTSTTTGNLINMIPAEALTSSGDGTPVTNTTPASATLHVGGVQPPSITKSFSSGTVWAGEMSRLSIVIRNHDPNMALTGASLTDDLPPNVFLADPVSPTLSGCGASATLSAAIGGTSVTLNNGSIAPNSTCTISVNVISNEQGTYTNRIPANSLQTDQDLTNVVEAVTRLHVQEIGVSKRFSPPTFPAGGIATLIITLQNPTGSPYTGVNLTDDLPPPLTVVSITDNTCGGTVSTTSTSIMLSGGTIPAGSPANPGTCRISIEITAPADTASGTFRNVIPPDGLTTEQGIGNLRPGTATVVITGTEVAAIKSFSPSTIQAGGNSRLRIDMTAPSDTDLTDFSIIDNLPAGLSVSNSTPPTATGCGPTPPMVLTAPTGATSISLTNGLIRAGERCRIEIYVTGTTAGLHTNIIQPTDITNNESRGPTGDVTSSLTIVSGGNQSIALVKGFNPLTVFGGSASTMSIELINPGSLTLSGIGFADNMPNGMILATPPNFNVGTCGGTLEGSPGDSSFTYSGGNLPPSGRCILTLSVTITVNGNLTNVIPSGAVTTTNGVINTDPAEATLTNLPGVSISKFFVSNPIRVNSSSALTITVQNTGNIALSGLGFSDSLPNGLGIAGGSAPAPVNNCGGTLIAASGTQLIQLTDGMLEGNSSCTIVVYITARVAGSYQNTIPPGNLTNDQDVTNSLPGTDTLVVRDNPEEDDDDEDRGQTPPRGNAGNFLIPVTGFAPGRVTRLSDSQRLHYEESSLTIEIPVLKVKSPIVGVESKQRRWDVAWLQDQVGWLQGTAYPTWDGNSLLTGHAVNADGKPGVFSGLKSLGIGEYIFLYSSGYRYTYEVVTNESVVPTDISVMKHEEKSVLTLITCDAYDEKTGIYLRRVAVRAVLVDVSLAR